MAKKVLKTIFAILIALVNLVLWVYITLWIISGILYGDNRELRSYVIDVPEINSGYAPQGITYCVDKDGKARYITTGYDSDDLSVVHVVTDNTPKRVALLGTDGNALKGHAGGIACAKDNVYIANDGYVRVFSLEQLIAYDGTPVPCLAEIPVDNNASYYFADDDYLYVGEFYREQNYPTADTHKHTTPGGDYNTAIVSCYALDSVGRVKDTYPEYCISVTDLVQGFAVKDGIYMLSRSYGLKNSALEYHSGIKDSGKTIPAAFIDESIPKKDVPLYYLDSSTLIRSLRLPAFSEDLTIAGDRVVVTNESACNKYFIGKLFGAWKVYSYPIIHS